MDSLSRPEFHGIFDRVSMDVELEGATTAISIENRLKVERHYAKTRAKTAKRRYARRFYKFKAEELDRLLEHDFAGRAIYTANIDPKGIVAQTLLYGRGEARRRILAQKRAAIRARGWYIRREKKVAEKVAKGLALRERIRRRLQRHAF